MIVGNLIINQSLEGNLAQGTVKVFPKLIDLEVMPSTEIQTFNHEGEYGYDNVTINAIKVKEHYLEGTNLILVLDGDSKLSIDISEYVEVLGGLTQEQIDAINNMEFYISDSGDLVVNYDETLLDIDFFIDEGLLLVNNNEEKLDFTINDIGEMEAIY
jgi:hypothetical protein